MVKSKKATQKGQIYVVATPIGNLEDFSPRAKRVLSEVDLIAAEDTRHSKRLLTLFNISTHMTAYHEYNEADKTHQLIEKILQGIDLALISDAGTPLISDPGFRLIQAAHENGIKVLAVPGPCAAIAALSIAGLPSDKFLFAGFLPAKSQARRGNIKMYSEETFTVIFYESSHRILACLEDMAMIIPDKLLVVARELTKTYETVLRGKAQELLDIINESPEQKKGEFVIVLSPSEKIVTEETTINLDKVLLPLLAQLPLKQAVELAVNITGLRKNHVYQRAIELT